MKKGYSYNLETRRVECVSDTFGANVYPETYKEIEFSDAPFLAWQSQGGDMFFEDGAIVHYPPQS